MRSSFIACFKEDARIDCYAGWVNDRAVFVVDKRLVCVSKSVNLPAHQDVPQAQTRPRQWHAQ